MSTVDAALVEAAMIAKDHARAAKQERARAMDAIIELLFERAEMRYLLTQCLPYLWVAPGNSDALSGRAVMPKPLARRIEAMLEVTK